MPSLKRAHMWAIFSQKFANSPSPPSLIRPFLRHFTTTTATTTTMNPHPLDWDKLFHTLSLVVYPVPMAHLQVLELKSPPPETLLSSLDAILRAAAATTTTTGVGRSGGSGGFEPPALLVHSFVETCLQAGYPDRACEMLRLTSPLVEFTLTKRQLYLFLTLGVTTPGETPPPSSSSEAPPLPTTARKRPHFLPGSGVAFLLALADTQGVDVDEWMLVHALRLCLRSKDSYAYEVYSRLRRVASSSSRVPPPLAHAVFESAVNLALLSFHTADPRSAASARQSEADLAVAIRVAEDLVETQEAVPARAASQLLRLLAHLRHPKLPSLQQALLSHPATLTTNAIPEDQSALAQRVHFLKTAEAVMTQAAPLCRSDEAYQAVARRLGHLHGGFMCRQLYYQMRAANLPVPSRGTFLVFMTVLSESGANSAMLAMEVYEDMRADLGGGRQQPQPLSLAAVEVALLCALRCQKTEVVVRQLRRVLEDFAAAQLQPGPSLWQVLLQVNEHVDILPYCGAVDFTLLEPSPATPEKQQQQQQQQQQRRRSEPAEVTVTLASSSTPTTTPAASAPPHRVIWAQLRDSLLLQQQQP